MLKKKSSFAQKPSNTGTFDNTTKAYLNKISRYKLLTQKEELELGKKIANGDAKAKKQLIQSNLRLVVNIAKKSMYNNLPLMDLIQEGNSGLIIAAEKYDYRRGLRFSTYATWWIKQSISKAVSEQSNSFKVPVYIYEILSKFSKARAEYEQKNNGEVDIKKIAKNSNISPKKIEQYLSTVPKAISIDSSHDCGDGNSINIADTLADNKAITDKNAEFDNLKKDIDEILTKLKQREQEVIKMRYGLGKIKTQTLEEIGRIYGVTKECIRQTELRAIKKLRELCLKNDSLGCYMA